MEKSFRNLFLPDLRRLRFVISIRVKSLIGHDVVLEESLEILLAILTE